MRRPYGWVLYNLHLFFPKRVATIATDAEDRKYPNTPACLKFTISCYQRRSLGNSWSCRQLSDGLYPGNRTRRNRHDDHRHIATLISVLMQRLRVIVRRGNAVCITGTALYSSRLDNEFEPKQYYYRRLLLSTVFFYLPFCFLSVFDYGMFLKLKLKFFTISLGP